MSESSHFFFVSPLTNHNGLFLRQSGQIYYHTQVTTKKCIGVGVGAMCGAMCWQLFKLLLDHSWALFGN